MCDLTDELNADPRVPAAVGVKNLVDKEEIRRVLKEWAEAQTE